MDKIEDRIKYEKERIQLLYDKDEERSPFARGIMAGICQTLDWLSEPEQYMEPVQTIPGDHGH